MTTTSTASSPLLSGQDNATDSKTPSKPLARTRSPTPPSEEPLRKRRRPESPLPKEPHDEGSEPTAEASISDETNDVKEDAAVPGAEKSSGEESKGDSADNTVSDEEEGEEGELPPLPPGPPPEEPPSDGWEAIWEPNVGQYYFYNHNTGETTWTNPRVPPSEAEAGSAPVGDAEADERPYTGYDPAIHGDYDPTASYAQKPERTPSPSIDPYVAHAAFNRFTGRFQNGPGAERYTDESRAKRQMEIYFDVDAAANCHDGRSLKAERQAKKLTKKEVKAFREKTRLKKEEKKRAWLRD